jgi:hypothetical protein
MTSKNVLIKNFDMSGQVIEAYLGDLSDADLLIRAVPGMNHVAWQFGHLIASEHEMLTKVGIDMPALPDGFAESHSVEASKSDDARKFLKKDQYAALAAEQRKGTLAALQATSEADLDRPTPEEMHAYAKTVGETFALVGLHVMMHAGQFVAVRRKLDKPITI